MSLLHKNNWVIKRAQRSWFHLLVKLWFQKRKRKEAALNCTLYFVKGKKMSLINYFSQILTIMWEVFECRAGTTCLRFLLSKNILDGRDFRKRKRWERIVGWGGRENKFGPFKTGLDDWECRLVPPHGMIPAGHPQISLIMDLYYGTRTKIQVAIQNNKKQDGMVCMESHAMK